MTIVAWDRRLTVSLERLLRERNEVALQTSDPHALKGYEPPTCHRDRVGLQDIMKRFQRFTAHRSGDASGSMFSAPTETMQLWNEIARLQAA